MNLEKFKDDYNSIKLELASLRFGDNEIKSKVDKISKETIKLFGKSKRVKTVVADFKNIIDKKEGYLFDICQSKFSNDLTILTLSKVNNEMFEMYKMEVSTNKNTNKKDVFIVHGHNEIIKNDVFNHIEKLGLNPIILHKHPNRSRTIIEKFIDLAKVNFAIVLLTADDFGYKKNMKSDDAKLRARQNVIFELGYFFGKIGRENVYTLYEKEDNFEFPSDYSGILYEPYDSDGRWKKSLNEELKLSGFKIKEPWF